MRDPIASALRTAKGYGRRYADGGEVDDAPSLMDQAKQDYPVLNNYDIGYKNNVGGGSGYMESWPPGEEGTDQSPRPKEFSLDKFGVENYRSDSKPSDVMADVTSHYLINSDPTVKQAYQNFTSSLEPWQHKILQDQYQYAVKNEGEKRPYEAWRDASGLPGYFRGYSFKQWPDDFNNRAYTPQQKQLLDSMVGYLKGNKYADGGEVDPEDESQAFAPSNMVSDEDLSLAKINQQAAPREGGLMQTVPQFAGLVQTPEGRSKLAEGARRWFTGDTEGKETGWMPSATGNPFVKPIVEMVKGPGEAMAGNMTPEQQADWGAGTALGLTGMHMPFAESGTAGIFGGKLSATADKDALAKAKTMEKEGVNRDKIWEDTGWGKDASGEWMYHHDISNAQLNPLLPDHPFNEGQVFIPEGKSPKLSNVFMDKDLYKAYPFLRDYAVVGHDPMGKTNNLGTHLANEKTIALTPQSPESMFNTLVHEINHAVQTHEGFAEGGNEYMFLPKNFQQQALRLRKQESLLNDYLKKNDIPQKEAWDTVYKSIYNPGSLSMGENNMVHDLLAAGKYPSMYDFMEKTNQHFQLRSQAADSYHRLAGEIASRNAEFRAKYNPEESRQTTPWASQQMMRQPVAPGDEILNPPRRGPQASVDTADPLHREAEQVVRSNPGTVPIGPLSVLDTLQTYTPSEIRRLPASALRLADKEVEALDRQGNYPPTDLKEQFPASWAALEERLIQLDELDKFDKEGFHYKPEDLNPDAGIMESMGYGHGDTPPAPPRGVRQAYDRFDDKFNEHIAPHFGAGSEHISGVSPKEEFYKNYFGGLYKKGSIISHWDNGAGFKFDGDLVGPDGNTIGSISREINPMTQSAHHGYLRLNSDKRGAGFVPNMLRNQIDLYRKMGIETVDMFANIDVGGYAWAKYGWLPTKDTWVAFANRWKADLANGNIAVPGNWNKDYLFNIFENKDPKAMWLLSDMDVIEHHSKKPIGKALLIDRKWNGTLNLTDQQAVDRFLDYSGRKAAKKQPNG